jgi:hypothetical protein
VLRLLETETLEGLEEMLIPKLRSVLGSVDRSEKTKAGANATDRLESSR